MNGKASCRNCGRKWEMSNFPVVFLTGISLVFTKMHSPPHLVFPFSCLGPDREHVKILNLHCSVANIYGSHGS
jgi:hypothetical protein